MSKVNTYACDECGKQKKDTNHWWMVYSYPVSPATTPPTFCIRPWDDSNADSSGMVHLCSADCVHKQLNGYLTDTSQAKVTVAA